MDADLVAIERRVKGLRQVWKTEDFVIMIPMAKMNVDDIQTYRNSFAV